MSRIRTRAIAIFILNILACSCISRTAVHSPGNLPTFPYKPAQASSLADYIRAVGELSHENNIQNAQERAALLSAEPALAELFARVEQDPANWELGLQLASAYLEHELYWSAYEMLTRLQIAEPNESKIDLNLAGVWEAWGQLDLARQHAERAIANGASSSQAYELLGRIQLRRNSPAEAITALLLAYQAGPDRSTAPANLGYAYMLQNDWPNARTYLEEAIQLDKTLVEAQNNLAIVLSQLGDKDGALRHLQQTSYPAVALNNMGVLFLRQDRLIEAEHSFHESLLLDPSYENAKRNLESVRVRLPLPSILALPPMDIPPITSGMTDLKAAAIPPAAVPSDSIHSAVDGGTSPRS